MHLKVTNRLPQDHSYHYRLAPLCVCSKEISSWLCGTIEVYDWWVVNVGKGNGGNCWVALGAQDINHNKYHFTRGGKWAEGRRNDTSCHLGDA